LICTTRRQIPASTSANQGPEKGDLTLQERRGVQLALGVLELMQVNRVEPDLVT